MTTKKVEKAAQIEENKRNAYLTKVRILIGYVGERMNIPSAIAAYNAKKDALLYAAEIVAHEPVGAAVWPQKADAVKATTEYANEVVTKNLAKLEAVGWDAAKLGVYPKHVSKYHTSPEEYAAYERACDRHATAHHFTEVVEGSKYCHEEKPCIVRRDDEKVLRFVTGLEEQTADQYNAFVCKLVGKIGPDAVSATLEGNHVWSYSTLTVTLRDGTIQRWKTQQITNCSVLGKYFSQWPTRLMKASGANP